jgi:hypothetical protein
VRGGGNLVKKAGLTYLSKGTGFINYGHINQLFPFIAHEMARLPGQAGNTLPHAIV